MTLLRKVLCAIGLHDFKTKCFYGKFLKGVYIKKDKAYCDCGKER